MTKKLLILLMEMILAIPIISADTTKGLSVKNGNVLVGTIADDGTNKLQVAGDATVKGNITSSGIINGSVLKYNNTDINSNTALSNVAYLDKANVFSQGQVVNGSLDVGGALGVGSKTTDGTYLLNLNTERSWAFKQKGIAAGAALLLESYNSEKRFLIGARGSEAYPLEILAATDEALQYVTIRGKQTNTGVVNIINNTSASNASSGALVISGGVGVGGDIYAGGNRINMTSSLDGSNYLQIKNTSNGINANAGVQLENNTGVFTTLESFGSGRTLNLFGKTIGNYGILLNQGINSNGLMIGTIDNDPVIIGTKNAERMQITPTGNVLIGTTTDDEINKLQVAGRISQFGVKVPFAKNNQSPYNIYLTYETTFYATEGNSGGQDIHLPLVQDRLGEIITIFNNGDGITTVKTQNSEILYAGSTMIAGNLILLKNKSYRFMPTAVKNGGFVWICLDL